MRSKIWSKIILIVCLCLVPEYSVFCVNFEEDDDRFGVDPIETEDRFGYFGDLMPPNFADFLSPLRRSNDDDFDDIDRYGKVKAENDNKEGFRSYIGNVFNPNPKAKNIFDVLNADTDDIDEAPIRSSNEQSLDDMDDDDDDGEVNRGKVKHPSMELIRRISPYWDKSNDSDRDDDRIIGKSASMKDSISRLIGIGHKSSTASPDEADGESKKDGGDSNDDDDDDDDDSDESDKKTTKMDGKSKGNIFSLLFSKSKKTSSDMDHKATTEANKLTTEKSSASNQTAFTDEDDDDDDDDEGESGDNSTSSSRASTIKASPESDSTIVTSLSLSTTDSTSTTSTTEKGKSHKHEEPSSTSSTPAPDNISSTEEVTKKHHKSHTSTMTMPSTTLAYETSHKPSETSPKNTKDTEGRDDDENKSNHKSSLEIIEAFLAGLGHESDYKKDNHNSTEVPATKSRKHSKTHKKKHGKKHKKTSALVPESMSTVLEETGSNFSSTTAKSENKSTTGTEVSSTIKPKGDTTTAIPTSSTDLGASFPVISITRTTSNEKYPRTDSSTAKSHANSNSQGSSTTPMPTLGPYVEDSDDILVTNESIVYSDWNPDVFP